MYLKVHTWRALSWQRSERPLSRPWFPLLPELVVLPNVQKNLPEPSSCLSNTQNNGQLTLYFSCSQDEEQLVASDVSGLLVLLRHQAPVVSDTLWWEW